MTIDRSIAIVGIYRNSWLCPEQVNSLVFMGFWWYISIIGAWRLDKSEMWKASWRLDVRKASMPDLVEPSPKRARAKDLVEPAAVPKKTWSTKLFATRSRRPWRSWRSARPGLGRQHGGTCGRLSWLTMMFNCLFYLKFSVLQSTWNLCHL